MQTKVYYNVQNGGDGSAYPRFFSSAELAKWDEDLAVESGMGGWAESSVGSIAFESDEPIASLDIVTHAGYFVELREAEVDIDEFSSKFFPGGPPVFSVRVEDVHGEYNYNLVLVDGVQVARVFRLADKSGPAFEEFLNS